MTVATLSFLVGLIAGDLICHAVHYLHRSAPDYAPGEENYAP